MKHTPGKWEVTKDHPVFKGKTIVVVLDEENSKSYRDKYKMICELTEIRGDSFTDNSEYTKANAALIASAPELLKENQQLKEQVKVFIEAANFALNALDPVYNSYQIKLLKEALNQTK